jgi:hypothetical protein
MMKPNEIMFGITKSDQLSHADCHKPLSDVVASNDPKQIFSQVGRLIGVTIKEPFAEAKDLGGPSSFTGAFRGWEVSSNCFGTVSLVFGSAMS